MNMVRIGALLSVAALAGCIAEGDEYGDEEMLEGEEELAESEDELINNGGGSLGYTCTTTIDGTNCECTMGVPKTDPKTCHGFGPMCHDKGATVTCKWPAGGEYTCSCSYKAVGSGSGKTHTPIGGGGVFAP